MSVRIAAVTAIDPSVMTINSATNINITTFINGTTSHGRDGDVAITSQVFVVSVSAPLFATSSFLLRARASLQKASPGRKHSPALLSWRVADVRHHLLRGGTAAAIGMGGRGREGERGGAGVKIAGVSMLTASKVRSSPPLPLPDAVIAVAVSRVNFLSKFSVTDSAAAEVGGVAGRLCAGWSVPRSARTNERSRA